MSDEITSAILQVGGSALIAIAIYKAGLESGRSSTVVDLLREFHSPEISKARAEAERFIRQNPTLALPSGFRSRSEPDDDKWENIYVVSRFFYRLNVLRKTKLIPNNKLREVFAPHFAFWWILYFEGRAESKEWTIRTDIVELYRWFAMESEKHRGWQDDWRLWLSLGQKVRSSEQITPMSREQTALKRQDQLGN